jgi:hypothetical protein
MRLRRIQPGGAFILLLALLATTAPSAPSAAEEGTLSPTGYVYLDVDGKPLPFQDHAAILEALRTGTIVEQKVMSRGVAQNTKLVLEINGVRFHAVFRKINVSEREKTTSKRIIIKYRDSWQFEIAAYELSELLGIGRVPPAVERTIDGVPGSIQIWMEGTTPEDLMVKDDRLDPPDKTSWMRQKSIMLVFDALIANSDRNQGNLLIDKDWNIWFIDQTRAFRETSVLIDKDDITTCERSLFRALRDTTDDAIRERVESSLTSGEMTKLLRRHEKLVKHIEKLIENNGETNVLFDLAP